LKKWVKNAFFMSPGLIKKPPHAWKPAANLILGVDELMQVTVRDNNVDQALRALKKKLQREGVYREMKMRRFYEKPSEKRARDAAAAVRRARKMDRKRMERDGLIPRTPRPERSDSRRGR